MLPYFKRSEDNARRVDDWHGTGGPLRALQQRFKHGNLSDSQAARPRGRLEFALAAFAPFFVDSRRRKCSESASNVLANSSASARASKTESMAYWTNLKLQNFPSMSKLAGSPHLTRLVMGCAPPAAYPYLTPAGSRLGGSLLYSQCYCIMDNRCN
ncbi:MAG TPA: hypothetical protein VEH77_02185 [Roseiarcus sp.]|nr:hypothetical protein [Roseiarcus sp.]